VLLLECSVKLESPASDFQAPMARSRQSCPLSARCLLLTSTITLFCSLRARDGYCLPISLNCAPSAVRRECTAQEFPSPSVVDVFTTAIRRSFSSQALPSTSCFWREASPSPSAAPACCAYSVAILFWRLLTPFPRLLAANIRLFLQK